MYNEQVRRGQVSEKAKFEYAWCLVRSKYIDDMKEGVALLEGTDKRCPIYQYCVLHHSLQISYSSLYHSPTLHVSYAMDNSFPFLYVLWSLTLWKNLYRMLSSYSSWSSHTKDFQIYGVQKLQMQNLSFSSMDVIWFWLYYT